MNSTNNSLSGSHHRHNSNNSNNKNNSNSSSNSSQYHHERIGSQDSAKGSLSTTAAWIEQLQSDLQDAGVHAVSSNGLTFARAREAIDRADSVVIVCTPTLKQMAGIGQAGAASPQAMEKMTLEAVEEKEFSSLQKQLWWIVQRTKSSRIKVRLVLQQGDAQNAVPTTFFALSQCEGQLLDMSVSKTYADGLLRIKKPSSLSSASAPSQSLPSSASSPSPSSQLQQQKQSFSSPSSSSSCLSWMGLIPWLFNLNPDVALKSSSSNSAPLSDNSQPTDTTAYSASLVYHRMVDAFVNPNTHALAEPLNKIREHALKLSVQVYMDFMALSCDLHGVSASDSRADVDKENSGGVDFSSIGNNNKNNNTNTNTTTSTSTNNSSSNNNSNNNSTTTPNNNNNNNNNNNK